MSGLRRKATAGFLWSALERLSHQGCALLIQIVLARLLTPEDFGLIAMTAALIAISGVFVESGLATALVQKQEVDDIDLSSVFYFNLAICVVVMAGLWFAAPLVADFYVEPELTWVLRALGLSLLLSFSGGVHAVILRRALNFRALFWVSTPCALVSGVVGIGLAYQGFGVWALVGQTLSQATLSSALLWQQVRWVPRSRPDLARLRQLLRFGSWMALSAMLDQAFRNVYVLVIGKAYSTIDVGLYQRASSLQQLPIANLQAVIGNVTLPILSSMQQDRGKIRAVVRLSLQLSGLLAFCGMALMAALAEPLVLVLIGDKWLGCVPMLQLLCVVGALYPLHAANLNVLMAAGRSDLVFRLQLVKVILTLANLVVTARLGIQAMIGGMVVTSSFALVLTARTTGKIIGYGPLDQARDVYFSAGLAVTLWGAAFASQVPLAQSPALKLGAGLLVAGGIFVLALRHLPSTIREELRRPVGRMSEGLAKLLLGRNLPHDGVA